ncbi:hypothetical protein GGI22_005585, partial [Coemansia erecta]
MSRGNDQDSGMAREHHETTPLLTQTAGRGVFSTPASGAPQGSNVSSPSSERGAWIAAPPQPGLPHAQRRHQRQGQRQGQRQEQSPAEDARSLAFSRRWWRQRIRYYVPIVGWLPTYRISSLATDVKAGFMVACLLVPQALSYGSLTHLPPAHGLYAALVPALGYAMLGTSRHLSMGPEALISVLTGTLVKGQLKHLYAAY